MAFFRTVSFSEPLPTIEGEAVYLRAPQMSDFSEWATLREASRAFLTPWEPTWPSDDLSRSAFRRRLRRYSEDLRTDQSYAFFLFRKSDHALTGGLTLANIRRGVAQAGSLGYWIGEPFARRGMMTGAVHALVPFAFGSNHFRFDGRYVSRVRGWAEFREVEDRSGDRRFGFDEAGLLPFDQSAEMIDCLGEVLDRLAFVEQFEGGAVARAQERGGLLCGGDHIAATN